MAPPYLAQAVAECAQIIDASNKRSAGPAPGEPDALFGELLARALACLDRCPSSLRVAVAVCDALAAVVRAEGPGPFTQKQKTALVQNALVPRLVGVLRDHGISEDLATAALSAINAFATFGKQACGLARGGGAIEAAVAALRAFPSSRAVNEVGWSTVARIITPLKGPAGRSGDSPEVELDAVAVQRLGKAGGPALALAALPRFRRDAPVSRLLIGAVMVGVVKDAERAPASMRSAFIQARHRS